MLSEGERLRAKASELREQADRLDDMAKRRFPNKWEVGMKVRYITDQEWGWDRGDEAEVVKVRPDYSDRRGDEYQVFYTGRPPHAGLYWTTPSDVEWVPE